MQPATDKCSMQLFKNKSVWAKSATFSRNWHFEHLNAGKLHLTTVIIIIIIIKSERHDNVMHRRPATNSAN